MTTEIFWLTATSLMTSVIWVPYILNRFVEMGVFNAILKTDADTTPKAIWATRLMKAHKNAVENLVIFAALVLCVQTMGLNTELTALAATTYFYARLTHIIGFTFSIPFVRTVSFLIGFACQLVLGLSVLGML